MKYTLCIAALVSAAFAASIQDHQPIVQRQAAPNVQNNIPASSAAMADQNGNVVAFDAANVYLDSQAKGL